jgi:prepilin-type N-terminal cleavage/methylation domain-containing protein
MMKKLHKSGFTIPELMIALAILAVLAAIAIPAYSDYLNRSRFSEGVIFAQKTIQDEFLYYQEHDSFPNSNLALGIESEVSGNDVSHIVIGAGGNVCAVFNGVHLSGVAMLRPLANGSTNLLVAPSLSRYAPQDAITASGEITPCEVPSVSISPQASVTPNVTTSPAATPVPTPSPTADMWSNGSSYVAGDTVSYNGKTYQARWWTRGNNPATNNGPDSGPDAGKPWKCIAGCD